MSVATGFELTRKRMDSDRTRSKGMQIMIVAKRKHGKVGPIKRVETQRTSVLHRVGLFMTMVLGVCLAMPSGAQEVVMASPDITIEVGAGVVVSDEVAVLDNQLGVVVLENLGPLPEYADLTAIGLAPNGDRYLSLDATVALPDGAAGVVVVRPGDVVRFDGAGYMIEFDAGLAGLPDGVSVDAVSVAPNGLLLSFDTTVNLGSGLVAADEDLVVWSGSVFSSALDGSAAGVNPALDLDAGQSLGKSTFLVSFDAAGVIDSIPFQDEDVLRYANGAWSLEIDASTLDGNWAAADLDAIQVPEPGVLTGVLVGCLALMCVKRSVGHDRAGRAS